MPKRSSKKQADHQQLARKVLDAVVPDAEPRPKKSKQDALDVARAVDEGMGQPQDQDPPNPAKNPAAVELGRLGGRKGGKARAEKLSAAKRKAIAKKAAATRWSRKKA